MTSDYRTTDLRRKGPVSEATAADETSQAKSNVDVLGRRWFAVPRTALELECWASDRAELMHYYQTVSSTPATAVFAIHESTFAKLAENVQDWLNAFGTTRDDVEDFTKELNATRNEPEPTPEPTQIITELAVRQLVGLWLSNVSAASFEASQAKMWLSAMGLGDPIIPSEQRVTFTAHVTFTFDAEVFDVTDVRRRKLCETLLERALTDIDGSVADIITVESSVDSESIKVEPIPDEGM